MDDEEHAAAINYLLESLQRLGLGGLTDAVYRAGLDRLSALDQLTASLRALRDEMALADNYVARETLDRLNSFVRTGSGDRITAIYVELAVPEARALGLDRIDLTERGEDLRVVLELLDELLADLEAEGRHGQ